MTTAATTMREYADLLTGTQVVVENDEGDLFTGILNKCSPEMEVELTFAQKLPVTAENKFVIFNKNVNRIMRMKAVRLSGDYCEKDNEKVFRTDEEIGLNGDVVSDQEFQQWEDDGDEFDDGLEELNERGDARSEKWKKKHKKNSGWSVDDMFRANRDKCVGESSFDENLTQYSNVEIGERTKAALDRANELAKQIENNPTSKRNALLENDDEERDLGAVTMFKGDTKNNEQKQLTPTKTQGSPASTVSPAPASKKASPEKSENDMKDESSYDEEKETDEKKSSFIFNPNASPFVPKIKDLNSKPPTPASNNFTPVNLSSQLPTFVPAPVVHQIQPATHGLPPPNMLYNNTLIYPHQQQQLMQSAIPLYNTFVQPNVAHQPATVFIQPNQPFLVQQQIPQQPYIAAMPTSIIPQSHSRTGTPTNGNVLHQQMVDTNSNNQQTFQQSIQPMPTTIFHNPAPSIATGANALPLMGQMPTHPAMMQIPVSMAAAYSHQQQQSQQIPNGTYVPQHQQFAAVNHQHPQHHQAQQNALSRNSSVHLPQHFQPTMSLQQSINSQQPVAAGIYAANPPYAQPLMQQQQPYPPPVPMSYYVQTQHSTVIPPSSAVPPPHTLTHTLPPPGHGPINVRQPH